MDNAYGIMGYSEQSQTAKDLVNGIKAACSEFGKFIADYHSRYNKNNESFSEQERNELLESCYAKIDQFKQYLETIENTQKHKKSYISIAEEVIEDFSYHVAYDIKGKYHDDLYDCDLAGLNLTPKNIIRKLCDVEMWLCRVAFDSQTPFNSNQLNEILNA